MVIDVGLKFYSVPNPPSAFDLDVKVTDLRNLQFAYGEKEQVQAISSLEQQVLLVFLSECKSIDS